MGFPSETNKDFEDTMNLIIEIGFDTSFSFIYSPRPGTPAAEFKDVTLEKEKKHRLATLQSQIMKQAAAISDAMIGTKQNILVTGISKKNTKDLQGRTENNRVVNFPSNDIDLVGQIINIQINEALPNCLRGNLQN